MKVLFKVGNLGEMFTMIFALSVIFSSLFKVLIL